MSRSQIPMARTLAGTRTAAGSRKIVRDMGTCLYFNGTSTNINCGASDGLNASGDVSFTFWYRLATKHYNGGPRYYVIRKDRPYILNFNPNGTFEVALHNGTGYTALATDKTFWEANQWHHIAFTSSTTAGRIIYLDGVNIKATGTPVVPVGTSSTFHIGSESASASWFKGNLDEVTIYHRVLTPTEVSDICFKGEYPTDDLKGFWKLDEGSGTSATDSSGSNTGTIANGTYSTDVYIKPRTAA